MTLRRAGRVTGCLAAFVLAIALTVAGSSSAAMRRERSASSGSKVVTATFAQLPGNLMNYIFPFIPGADDTLSNATQFSNAVYPPLYWYGAPGKVGVNQSLSVANLPVITYSGNKTVATVTLKPWKWSNGQPITTRDVSFWYDIMTAEKVKWPFYIKGEFPDNVGKFSVVSPSKFVVTFKGHYGELYTQDELSQLEPIPQKVWDKTSSSGKVGNYDETPAGARAVYQYLNAQSLDLRTYATNPLWQVVDGAWKIQSFTPSTTAVTLVRNRNYSGSATGTVTQLKFLQFTSSESEFADLLSGSIDFGYLPTDDIPQISRLEQEGYEVVGWPAWGFTFAPLNFSSETAGPLFKQLYIRQALQYEINQPLDIKSILDGYGYTTNGPAPAEPASQFVSKQQASQPYPYNPAKAKALLQSHGWRIAPNGADVCVRPGSGTSECGSGIAKGKHLAFKMSYASGIPFIESEVEAFKSDLTGIGVDLSLAGEPFAQDFSQWAACSSASCWQSLYWSSPGWIYNDNVNAPFGDVLFDSTGASNGGQYNSAEADKLLDAVHSGSLPALYAYENYISKDLPVLWFPNTDQEIAVIKKSMTGALPLDPDQNIYPQDWSFR